MSLFGSGRKEGLLAVLTLLLICIALHAPGLFFGKPRDVAGHRCSTFEASTNRDTLLPAMHAAGAAVRAGEFPLWNPTTRLGEPFLTSGAPVLYPPFWLLMLDGSANILELLFCLHSFLACMLMYRLCRILPLSRYVAFLAGALYGMGWFMTAQLDRLPDAAAAALLPLAMEFSWRVLISRRRATYAGLLSLAVTLMFVTGGTGTAVLGTALCCALFLYGLWALDRENQRIASRLAIVAGCLTALLTAPLWVHHLVHVRCETSSAGPSTQHLQPAGLLGVLMPDAFGGLRPAAPEGLRMINPSADPLELVLYPGSIVLFLGLLGLLRPKRTSTGLFWVLVLGAGLMLSIDGPIADALWSVAPWLPARPGNALVLVHFAFVMLAAAALESFFEAPTARPFAARVAGVLTVLVSCAVLVVAFAVPSAGDRLVGHLASGTAGEIREALLHLRMALLPTALFCLAIGISFLLWRRLGMLRFKLLLETLVIANVLTVAVMQVPRDDRAYDESHLIGRIPESAGRAVVVERETPVSPTPLRASGTPTITSSAPAILCRTADLLRTIDPSAVLIDHRTHVLPLQSASLLEQDLLRVAGVGVALTGSPGRLPGFAPIAPAPLAETRPAGTSPAGTSPAATSPAATSPAATSPAGTSPAGKGSAGKGSAGARSERKAAVDRGHVHTRIEPVRRARVYFDAVHADSIAEARDALHAISDHATDTVILEGVDAPQPCRRPASEPKISMLVDLANTVRMRVAMGEGRGYLVLADAFAPGWHATVDGRRARIHPANVALRAVALGPGDHEVTFHYAPWMCRIGLPIAAFGVMLLLGWLLFTRPRRR